MSQQRFVQIDEEGYFSSSGLRVTDDNYGQALLENMRVEARGYTTIFQDEKIIVEAFDQPLVARHIEILSEDRARAHFAYGFAQTFELKSLCADMWDRFHARTIENNVPLVLSRTAQMELFNVADSFDDDTITIQGAKIKIQHLQKAQDDVQNQQFWSEKYNQWQSGATEQPPWELNAPAAPLASVLNQIKLPRSRICNLGCGSGHDAAFLADHGHIVTGVDWSDSAINLARDKYGEGKQLHFVNDEAFDFAKQHPIEFDLIFEHTFFCAIDPTKREALVQAWRRMLVPEGHLLAIFFILDQVGGSPPFGVSEWELRETLKPHFDFLFWTRWRHSTPDRLGRELVVYAKKKELTGR